MGVAPLSFAASVTEFQTRPLKTLALVIVLIRCLLLSTTAIADADARRKMLLLVHLQLSFGVTSSSSERVIVCFVHTVGVRAGVDLSRGCGAGLIEDIPVRTVQEKLP